MNTMHSVFSRSILLLGLLSGCFPEQPPSDSAGGQPGVGGKVTHPHGGKPGTGNGGGGGGDDAAPDGDTVPDGDPMPTMPDAGAPADGYIETRELVETCTPAQAALALPQRAAVMSDSEQTAQVRISVDDLWGSFNNHCGHCHVAAANGGYQVDRHTFAALVTKDTVKNYIEATDPNIAMPRGSEGADDDHGIDFSKRPDTDPIRALANSLLLWIGSRPPDVGPPDDVFYIPNPDLGTQSVFLMTPEVASCLTNIGSCVPANDFTIGWGVDRHKKMKDLDAMFANLQRKPRQDGVEVSPPEQLGLPLHLSDTDLFTFDTQELARYGVIGFAPAYPLWSDGSGKLRYVRVPLGQSIQYHKDTKEFTIPPNTRFYKTFMKQVIDRGSQAPRYRKIETRLIVSRPDNALGDPGALFGTYVWNEDETEATLLGVDGKTGDAQLQRDLTPFPDVITSYYTDEGMADAIRGTDPPPRNETYALEQAHAASGEPVLRHYLLPGKERCLECHMGSVRGDFVLGFTPMQISRRPVNEGGVIEDTGPDELTQLDRLSALGVITGVSSAADIPHLEDSEGTRQQPRRPRNNHELVAQGYMFGNCAHCHNPVGYATNSVPELGPLLNFWPSASGGIFQFPLDRISTRTTRGAEGRGVPYITPSLYDMLPYGYIPTATNGAIATADYIPKFFTNISDDGSPVFDLAPWRSLIYRNTETPFTYGDDLTIFPHMPLNTSGYDCRASQILGSWMVSIPAQLKPGAPAEGYVGDNPMSSTRANVFPGDPKINNDPQPYVEVAPYPNDPTYNDALAAASERVFQFQNGMRYRACPSNADVIDVGLVGDTANQIPLDSIAPKDGVPDQTNFVATDLTESPGAWQPRGDTWKSVLLQHVFAPPPTEAVALATYNQVRAVASDLTDNGGVVFDKKLDDFVSTPIPFAPWKPNPKCDFSQPVFAKTQAQTYDNLNKPRPRWLDLAKVPPTTPIMEKLPGGNVFDMICINCHGPNMDSKGRQADTVQQITGGASRVANFLTGLFGPTASPGTNRATVFADAIGSSATSDDWGARYMSWMALGGTTAKIPRLVLNLVGRSVVAGTTRPTALVEEGSVTANMLESARLACRRLFFAAGDGIEVDLKAGNLFGIERKYRFYPLIQTNGDAELWEHLCSINNPPIIRGINVSKTGAVTFGGGAFYLSTAYPANTPIGNQRGESAMSGPNGGVTDDNYVPWCVVPGYDAPTIDAVNAFVKATPTSNGKPPPMCPTSLVQATTDQIDAFALRGAINAGFAVFRYIDLFSRGKASRARFDECTLATPSP